MNKQSTTLADALSLCLSGCVSVSLLHDDIDIRGLACLAIRYNVPFPCSLIVTTQAVQVYNRLHNFSMQMHYCRQLLHQWQVQCMVNWRTTPLGDTRKGTAAQCKIVRVRTMLLHVIASLQTFFWIQADKCWKDYCEAVQDEVLNDGVGWHTVTHTHTHTERERESDD
jgi:hypothetical protein